MTFLTVNETAATSRAPKEWAAILQYDAAPHSLNQYRPPVDRNKRRDSTSTEPSIHTLPRMPSTCPMKGEDEPFLKNDPPALTVGNAILINRELDRIQHRPTQQTQRHWRMIAGTVMLLILIPNTYILSQYIYAYLTLSPSGWPLSKSIDGTKTSPDNLMRSLALSFACLSIVGIIFSIACGFYLRVTRRFHKMQWFHLMSATISALISLALSVANLALIAIWHNIYFSSSSPHAQTRDVSKRCRDNWAMDILFNAASFSTLSRVKQNEPSSCQHNLSQTLKTYYIAGGTRLILFVILCAIWLQCIARYHHSLSVNASSNESAVESAEMRRLLQEEEKRVELLETGVQSHNDTEIFERNVIAPRLNRFQWQRTGAFASGLESNDMPSRFHGHEKGISTGGWTFSVVGQVLNVFRGNFDESIVPHEAELKQRKLREEKKKEGEEQFFHERQVSKWGVRDWFNGESSGLGSEENERDEVENGQLIDCPQNHSYHMRMSSQEGRAREGRHAAAHLMHIEEEGNCCFSEIEKQKRDQEDRIAYLASIGYNITSERRRANYEGVAARRSSSSAGDELPHMPELIHCRTKVMEDGIDEDDEIYWRVTGLEGLFANEEDCCDHVTRKENLYVRALGKLVRKMSDIKSVGSQERLDRRSRSNGRSGSEM